MLELHVDHVHCHAMVVYWMLVILWVVLGDEFESEDPVENVCEEQGFDLTEEQVGKMIIP